MNYFIAYRHTGEDPQRLFQLLPAVREAFFGQHHVVYCTYFDEDTFASAQYSARDIMEHAFRKIEEMGHLFVVQDSTEKSEGMIMEVGYCRAKGIPITLAKRRAIFGTYLPDMADRVFEYATIEELEGIISRL